MKATKMPPPDGGSRLERKLWHLAGEIFPPWLQRFGYRYLKHTVYAVSVIEKRAPEANSELIIHKFCNELKRNGVSVFTPFTVYLGGRYSNLLNRSLNKLVTEGVLQTRSSNHPDINVSVFEVNDRYQDDVERPSVWFDVFQYFRERFNLKNPLEDHGRKRMYKWIKNREAYLWVNSELVNPGHFESISDDLESIKDETDEQSIPSDIEAFEPLYQEPAKILYTIINEYKNVPAPGARMKDNEDLDYAKRKFSIHHLNEDYNKLDEQILGEAVFLVGYFDIGEETWQNAGPDLTFLRANPTATESIGIKLPESLDGVKEDVYKLSVGVLGIVSERKGEIAVEPIALLKSGELPKRIIQRQQEERKRRRSELEKERNEILHDLKEAHEEAGAREERIQKFIDILDEYLEENDLDDDERDILSTLKQLLALTATSKGIGWVMEQVMDKYPEYISLILDALGL